MLIDLDRRELSYVQHVVRHQLEATQHTYERNQRMFGSSMEMSERYANMEAEIKVLTSALDKLILGIADCNIDGMN
ncbi:MAG: hypothetical protein KH230_09420 [Enterocloster asparagiformis]|nr:hypothetical protein [Enterocloster asparagiformis]